MNVFPNEEKKISPYALAAVLIMARLFALSMYTPAEDENAALTAVTAAIVCLLKLPLFMGAARLSRSGKRRPMVFGALTAVAAAGFIIVSADSFADMLESIYPERTTKLAVAAVLIFVCAYTSSMGITGTARTACIMLGVFALVIIPVLFEMRGGMLTDRIDLYSDAPLREISRTAGELLRLLPELVIFAGLLPYAGNDRKSAARAAKTYLIADSLICGIFFLMHAAVMGRFFGRSGYAFFTLSYNTHGSIIDRANGVFTCVASVSAVMTIAALMLVLRRSIETIGLSGIGRERVIPLSAVIAALILTAAIARNAELGQLAPDISLITGGAVIAGTAVTALDGGRRAAKA